MASSLLAAGAWACARGRNVASSKTGRGGWEGCGGRGREAHAARPGRGREGAWGVGGTMMYKLPIQGTIHLQTYLQAHEQTPFSGGKQLRTWNQDVEL